MGPQEDLKRNTEIRLITNDIIFARRFLESVAGNQEQAVIPIFCMNNYLSLFIHESHKTLKRIEPQLADALNLNNAPTIERARHTVKLFDDNKKKFEGVRDYFAHEIIPAHKSVFLGNTWFPPARALETDLGLYHYCDRLISTTHVANFYLGVPAAAFTDMASLGRLLLAVASDQGAYVATLADDLPWQGQSFLECFNAEGVEHRGVKSWKYYKRTFGVEFSLGTTAALTAFLCSLNSVDLLLTGDAGNASHETIFKLKFITLYHVVSSLTELRMKSAPNLSRASERILDAILDSETSTTIVRDDQTAFRNTLIHYGLDSRLDFTQLSLDLPLCGLVEAYFPSHSFSELSEKVGEHVKYVAELLHEWSRP